MNGEIGRYCGGIGFGINYPLTKISVERVGNVDKIEGTYSDKMRHVLDVIRNKFDLSGKYHIRAPAQIAEHIGLGSESQMYLALADTLLKLEGKHAEPNEVIKTLKLGGVSGIGHHAYYSGGLVVDGGYSFGPGKDVTKFTQHSKNPAPLIARHDFPDRWKVILAIPRNRQSLSGELEDAFFIRILPLPLFHAQQISHETLMHLLPAVAIKDFDEFIISLKAITALGQKPFEVELNREHLEKILDSLERHTGFSAVTSLGPTCYSFIDATKIKKADIARLLGRIRRETGAQVVLTSVRNYKTEPKIIQK